MGICKSLKGRRLKIDPGAIYERGICKLLKTLGPITLKQWPEVDGWKN